MDSEHNSIECTIKVEPLEQLPDQCEEEMITDGATCVIELQLERTDNVEISKTGTMKNLKKNNTKKSTDSEFKQEIVQGEFELIKHVKQEVLDEQINTENKVVKEEMSVEIDIDMSRPICDKAIKKEQKKEPFEEIYIVENHSSKKLNLKQEELEMAAEDNEAASESNDSAAENNEAAVENNEKKDCAGAARPETRTIAGMKFFECEICQRKFAFKGQYNTHLRMHTGEKPFECKICEKKFSAKCYLNVHLKKHTGKKPFQCDKCQRCFSVKSNLNMHLKTHTGEKRFLCDICQRRFTQKGHLDEHLKTHAGERPFECQTCKMKFSHKSNYNSHLRTHTGEKPFECEICFQRFSRKNVLNTHLKIHSK